MTVSTSLRFAVVLMAVPISNCATVPPLSDDGIAIAEIVQRVKCELADAVPTPQPPYPTGPYQWMKDWTAKIDLTLITNQQSAVTPTAMFISPLLTQNVPGVGSIMRSFSFGVGGGLNTTAVREETLSFTLSLAELRNTYYQGTCQEPAKLGLLGNLGLREWVHSALAPVEYKQLFIGKHAPPGSKATPVGPSATAGETNPLKKDVDDMLIAGNDAEKYAGDALVSADLAKKRADDALRVEYHSTPQAFISAIQATYDAAETANGQADTAAKAAATEQKLSKKVAAKFTELTKADPAKLSQQERDFITYMKANATNKETADSQATKAAADATKAQTTASAAIQHIPHDPPIDAIGHQVQFVVAVSGNASPSWTLVNFKGPATTGTLVSASRSITHTLNIGMGAPTPATGAKAVGPEAFRQLDILHLDSATRQLAPQM